MRLLRLLALSTVAAVLWPTAAQACTCGIASRRLPGGGFEHSVRTTNWDRPWEGREVVFTGYAIEVETRVRADGRQSTRVVRFVTEESWRGALPDTLTLLIGNEAPCANFFPGWRYLVSAFRDTVEAGRLTTGICDNAMTASKPLLERARDALGEPGWKALPVGQRELDRTAIRLGTPLPRVQSAGQEGFYGAHDPRIARMEFGDYDSRTARLADPIAYPLPGLYHVRLTWADGTVFLGYLSICRRLEAPGTCEDGRPHLNALKPIS
jgi:hypothetical protein